MFEELKLFLRKPRVYIARRKFLKMVKAVNEGKIDYKNLPRCGHIGEERGSSRNQR